MRKRVVITLSIVLILCMLFGFRIIPKQIAKFSSNLYISRNYSERELEFSSIEFSKFHSGYFVAYEENGHKFAFLFYGKYFPVYLEYDPLNPPG